MSWIEEVEPARAEGELKTLYRELEQTRGKVSNILKVHGLRPGALKTHLDLYLQLMFAPGGLSRAQREMIAVAVSNANNCEYCVAHHQEALARYEKDPDKRAVIAENHPRADITAADRAMLDYAVKLTRDPGLSDEAAIKGLREHGFDDADILLITLIVGYFNFVNRIALGLGVEFNEDEMRGYQT